MVFVIADASGEMAKILYNDLLNDKTGKYIVLDKSNLFNCFIINKICQINISLKLNLKVRMPLKKYFFKQILRRFSEFNDICFLLGTSWFDQDFIDMIKIMYPKAKLILNFHDTVESKMKRFPDMNILKLHNTFDLIYSYSILDVKKYGFEFIPDMYSKLDITNIPSYEIYDVVFIGNAKGRENLLIKIHEKLVKNGVKCWFYVVGVKTEQRKYSGNGFIFGDKKLPFMEVIGREISSKCILEITQEGCIDSTLRFWDAVMYDRRIITNCKAVKNYSYYNTNNVLLFSDVDDIDCNFIYKKSPVKYNYCGDISPVRVLELIENRLKQ